MRSRVFTSIDTLILKLESIHVDGYGIYYVLRSIFEGRILISLCTTQYSKGVDTFCTMYYAIFFGVDTIYTINYAVF